MFNSHIDNYEILEPYLQLLLIKSNILLRSIKYHLKQRYNKIQALIKEPQFIDVKDHLAAPELSTG